MSPHHTVTPETLGPRFLSMVMVFSIHGTRPSQAIHDASVLANNVGAGRTRARWSGCKDWLSRPGEIVAQRCRTSEHLELSRIELVGSGSCNWMFGATGEKDVCARATQHGRCTGTPESRTDYARVFGGVASARDTELLRNVLFPPEPLVYAR